MLGLCLSHAGESSYSSPFLRAEFSPSHPAFATLSMDSLRKGKPGANLLHPPAAPSRSFAVVRSGAAFDYLLDGELVWRFEFPERQIKLRSHWAQGRAPWPLLLSVNTRVCHATLLGRIDEDSSMRLPALLHLPDFGTLRIHAAGHSGASLPCDANRREGGYWVKVAFPAATRESPRVEYTLDAVNIRPGPAHKALPLPPG